MGRRRKTWGILSVSFAFLIIATGLSASELPRLRPLMERAAPSVVRVRSRLKPQNIPLRLTAEESAFVNTGFFVDADGHVLTSVLGVAGCEEIRVIAADGTDAAADLVALDQPSGLALLSTALSDTTPLQPAEKPPEHGGLVLLAFAAGAEGLHVGFAPGLVTAAPDQLRMCGMRWSGLFGVSVSVGPGSAAAPFVDEKGRLAGVLVGEFWREDGGRALALPAEQLQPVLRRLREGRSRRIGWLGLALAQERGRHEGVRVQAVLENSPAARAGLQAGDVLLQIGGETIEGPDVLAGRVAEAQPGRRTSLKVLRQGELETIEATLGERPLLICSAQSRPGEGELRLPRPRVRHPAGLKLMEQNRRLRERLRHMQNRLRQLESAKPAD